MKSFDFEAVTFDADVYCIDCLPDGVTPDSEDVSPVFADSEWDTAPVCCVCGAAHDYMTVLDAEDEDVEPIEPQEDDILTEDHKKFYQYGRLVLERAGDLRGDNPDQWFGYTERASYKLGVFNSCEAAIRAYMDRVQFWPNAWFISDHGNAHRIDLTEGKE